jgi:hypothetical protein
MPGSMPCPGKPQNKALYHEEGSVLAAVVRRRRHRRRQRRRGDVDFDVVDVGAVVADLNHFLLWPTQ